MKFLIFGLFWTVSLAAVVTKKSDDRLEEYEEEFVVPFNGQKFDVFDWQLCNAVADADPGNVLISPISVKFLLNMLYEGSTGETAKELEKILQLPEDKNFARMKSSAVLRSLQTADPNYVMEIGTKIFVDHSMTPKNWFQRILYLYYNAYIEKLNITDYKTAVGRVNNWVESVTHGHIKDLITQGNLNHATMLLVNAVYFKGTWKSFFQSDDTFDGNFETYKGPKKIPFMKQTTYFYYTRSVELDAQILRLPYEGQKFAMYIILPEKKDGLDNFIKTVNPFMLRKHIWQMEETSTEVILPKFKFSYKTDLKPVLRKLGFQKIFDSFGEMKGLVQTNNVTNNLVVSSVIQKAGIEVNEEGTVAAAASEMQLINKIGIQDELFNASHPFLFFIEDETTGTIVFVGKFMGPNEDKEPEQGSDPSSTPAKGTKGQPTTTTTTTTTTTKKPMMKTETGDKRTDMKSTTMSSTTAQPPRLFELKQKRIKAETRPPTFTFVASSNDRRRY